MKTLTGTYGKDCKVFTDNIEPQALETIQKLLDNPVTEGKPVRIMPDTHDGKGIVIGFTMPVGEWVNPNHIGVDIGCGMLCAEIKSTITPDMYIDIDRRIREVVPMGFEVHEKWYGAYVNPEADLCNETIGKHVLMLSGCNIKDLLQKISMDKNLWGSSIGSLGGGNHFIELGRSEKTGKYYLSIHSGSRNFGKRVCDYHAKNQTGYRTMLSEKVSLIKEIMPKQQWNSAIKEASKQLQGREGYLTGLAKEEYMNDMYTAQAYASVNRYAMLHLILQRMGWKSGKVIETVHNYISPKDGIIRKGAVSAHLGEELIIPMNMADGILLCRGKGNEDWNCSAPHGAGRLFSRTAAKEQLSMDEFCERMSDVYSTSVCESTLDESPMAYKPTEEIRSLIEPTVEVLDVIKPVINLKAK